jgi:hypothetical protein
MSAPMVVAILRGVDPKTQTRRLGGLEYVNANVHQRPKILGRESMGVRLRVQANQETGGDMKIYSILIRDRHSDPTIELSTDREEAKLRAHELAKKYARFPEDIEIVPIRGWVLHINYSCEGDSVTVHEHELDLPSETHSTP